MPKSRRRSIEEFNANLDLLEHCVAAKTWNKLKQFIGRTQSIKKREVEKFYSVIGDISAEEWEKYLRKLRDKEYESNRARISLKVETAERLKSIMKSLGYKSFDEMFDSIFVSDDVSKKVMQLLEREVRGKSEVEIKNPTKRTVVKKSKLKKKIMLLNKSAQC
ncbi:hypothetical protein [Shewanella zhangzhouensis]|uniref:hypothetical protein n=1 Tax=Shewanella zhangzhouensis TaxID=2864213 RepID=UPI001C6591EA|nr:hypothetical protein [Shewanella zhangzhouensis]QYK05820.1 hypothetical protein K0H63_02965 [Shewanella zhangzhouensis]